MKDKRAFLFYFLMTLIFLDFANQIKVLSYNPAVLNYDNFLFSIVHVNNSGGAFSLFQNNAYILACFAVVVLAYIAFYVFKKVTFEDKFTLLSLTLFSAGTLGNLIERIKFNYVVDYIKLNFIDFPIFNSFDIMITVGIALYILFVLFKKETVKENKNNDKN